MREGVLAITVAEWTRDIALVLSGVTGLLHWDWWYPVVFGVIAAVVREASQGFVLIQHCGSGYLIRSVTTPIHGLRHPIQNGRIVILWLVHARGDRPHHHGL